MRNVIAGWVLLIICVALIFRLNGIKNVLTSRSGKAVLTGRYSICILLFYLTGVLVAPAAVSAAQVVDVQVNAGTDDAEEGNSSVSLSSSDLDLTDDGGVNQTVGMRFANVALPKGAQISKAYIQFQVDETDSTATTLAIHGEAADDALTFSSAGGDITSRPRTAASVAWMPPGWPTTGVAGIDQRTPDIRAIIQEIVNRNNWASGNALAVIIDGNGKRVAESYNGDAGGAPLLHVEYGATQGNEVPSANAGEDRSLLLPEDTLCLTGTAGDDGVPGALSVNWLQQGGPDTVVLENPSAYSTTATFPAGGNYTMTFQASDGELSATDDLLVTVGRCINVPGDAATIQAGVDLAGDGDVIVLAPGIYSGMVLIEGKAVTITSRFYDTGDRSFVDQTILDGGSANDVVRVNPDITGMTNFIGITLRNGDNGITAYSPISVLSCRITDNSDGIDFEPGATGVFVRDSLIDLNQDDAVDFDGTSWGIVERNWPIDNQDDGIEIRLPQGMETETVRYVIRDNIITRSGEDGIQIIGHRKGTSNREFLINGNLIGESVAAGVALMCCSQTVEQFEGAALSEYMLIRNNTFRDNSHGIIGGDNITALNNIFVGHDVALKRLRVDSVSAHSLVFGNNTDFMDVNVLPDSHSFFDPLLAGDGTLQAGSPAIDAGVSRFDWNGATVLDLPFPDDYAGAAPDLGAFESPVNDAPSVDAGEDLSRSWSVDPVPLSGVDTDDGLPETPGALSIAWTQLSGPCGVLIGDANATSTTATFAQPGNYVFRLSAHDGEFGVSDEVNMVLQEPSPAPDGDGDGIPDEQDNCPLVSNPLQEDGDADGVGDLCDTCPTVHNQDTTDDDLDGLTAFEECINGTDPTLRDTDGDGLSDGEEVNACGTDPTLRDSDGYGFSDGLEVGFSTLPNDTAGPWPPADGDLAPMNVFDGLVNVADVMVAERIALGLMLQDALAIAHGDLATSGTSTGTIDTADVLLTLQQVLNEQ
jgi:hypothetical protein